MKNKQLQKNIPSDWQEVKLGEFCDISAGGTPSTKIPEYWEGGGVPWANSAEIKKNDIFYTENFITQAGLKNSSAKMVPTNSVLIALAGQGSTRGKVAINKIPLTTNQSIAFFIPKKDIDYRFLRSNLKKRYQELRAISAGDGGRGGLNLHILKALKIKLPLLPEQNRIVSVLETWDEIIEKLEKKIVIKKEIKKGLMQNLLAGKKRLKGFSEDWKSVALNELLDYEQPTQYIVANTDYNPDYKTPVLTAGKTFILGYTNEIDGIFQKKDLPVIIFDDFTAANKFVDFPFKVKSSAMKILKNKNFTISNIVFVFNSIQLLNFQVGEHKRCYLSEYQYLDIKLPSLKEQTAIAKILTTADKEISKLENKLNLIKDQKKYLLNNLITGKIRTPENLKIN